MRASTQGVGRAKHEKRAVKHVGEVIRPFSWLMEKISGYDLPNNTTNKRHHEPGKNVPTYLGNVIDAA